MDSTKDKSTSKILAEAKKVISSAYAIWPLRSRDIDIVVLDQATKDYILNQPEVTGYKILQQDYLVEVLGVLLSLQVASRKDADNSQLIKDIYKETKRNILGIAINSIR
jgi:hypothetical protein